ncbi:helix-turn-helix transcriptional regulator [Erwinia sp. E602]|uniref:helix-turn-helix transcriptional regulator n=1 Tax=Erwinia sp. E602 TaxID=2675378 RepID=UPI002012D0DD|nr:helix-turn-helix transcriptional regulator [Erwinia sp. E602]
MMNDNGMKEILASMIHFFSQSNEPWGIKNRESQFVFVNKRQSRLLGISEQFDYEGRVDEELPCSLSEFGNEFRRHDRRTEESGDKVTSLEVHAYENHDYLQPWFFDKFPLYDATGACRGTVWHGRPVENIVLTRLKKIKIPTSLVFTPPSALFSDREWEILFYLLQTYTVKETASCLGLSQRTVGNYVQNMYEKIGVNNKRSLFDFCHDNNITNYIPQSFFKRSGSLPLVEV